MYSLKIATHDSSSGRLGRLGRVSVPRRRNARTLENIVCFSFGPRPGPPWHRIAPHFRLTEVCRTCPSLSGCFQRAENPKCCTFRCRYDASSEQILPGTGQTEGRRSMLLFSGLLLAYAVRLLHNACPFSQPSASDAHHKIEGRRCCPPQRAFN